MIIKNAFTINSLFNLNANQYFFKFDNAKKFDGLLYVYVFDKNKNTYFGNFDWIKTENRVGYLSAHLRGNIRDSIINLNELIEEFKEFYKNEFKGLC